MLKAAASRASSPSARDEKSDARLLDLSLHASSSAVHASILGHDIIYKLGMPGRHMAMNSLAVLAAASLAGADLALAALALSQVDAGGRPRRAAHAGSRERRGHPDRRELQRQSGVDGGRHQRARPGRDRPAAADALPCSATCSNSGPTGAELHRGLADAVKANRIDLVYCCGPLMRNLWDALSAGKRGGYAENSAGLEAQVVGAIRAGDAIMIKGSLGSKMKTIVNALEKRFPGSAHDEAAG